MRSASIWTVRAGAAANMSKPFFDAARPVDRPADAHAG
jgi:hypothetical protein